MNVDKILKYAESGKIDKLVDIADGKDMEMAKAAIAALAKVKKDESFNYFVSNLRTPNKERRLAIISAMGDYGAARGKTHLRHLIDTETDPDIVATAKVADAKLTGAK